MKNSTLLSVCIFLVVNIINAQVGFNTITNLSTLTIPSSTGESPQSKVWTYAGKHWTVLTNSTDGTSVYRLDGTNWTNVLNLASGTSAKADTKVVGNITHIFVYKGTGSYLFSVEYDPATGKYKKWSTRPARTDVTLETGVKAATIDIDATGRMWLASDGTSTINVRWSDAPYTSFSTPVTIATGVTSTDLCEVVALPSVNKVGIFWSNKNSKRYGFRTHQDGADPTAWAADEAPGAASALNIGSGFADNQFNVKATQNGTVYSTIKTNYTTNGYPQVELLIRRPDGTWDTPYPVTNNEGTYPLVILSESLNKLKVIYSLTSGTVAYKESSISAITFSLPFTLINGPYNHATSTKASYASEVVVLASNGTTGVGVLGIDYTTPPDQIPPAVVSINRQSAADPTSATSVTYRTSFSETVNGVDVSDFSLAVISGSLSGTVSSVSSVSGSVYDVTVSSINGSGTLRLDLNSSNTGIIDIAGNGVSGGFTAGQTFTINQGIPTLTSVGIASNNSTPSLAKPGDVISLSFTASEPINPPVVTIATHAVSATPGSGNSYTAAYTMTVNDASGVIPFSINFSNTAGTAGTQVTATANGSSVNFDNSAPTVVSINRQSPATNPTNATSVIFRSTFSEPVNGIDITDFSLTTSGTASGTISSVTPVSGSLYDIAINSVGGTGTLRLDVNSSATIIDIAGNAATGDFTGGQTFTIEQGIPTLTSVNIASNNGTSSLAKPGDVISLSFTASDPINAPLVTIATHQVSATAGTGNNFTATYAVTISDAEGNVPFTIDFTSTTGVAGAQVSTTTNGSSVNFDKTIPAVVSINRQSAADPTSATSVTYRTSFPETVNGVDVSDFSLAVISGSLSGTVSSVSSVSGSVYDVTVSSINGSGTLRLDLNSSNTGIIDIAGNGISGGFTAGQTFTIDQGIPTLTSVGIASNNSTPSLAKPGDVISLSFTASEPINPPVVTIATHAVSATPVSGNSYTAAYTMTVNDASGVIPFNINFSNTAGTAGAQVTSTSNGSSVSFDNISPTVVSISRQVPTTSTTNSYTLTFRATFNETVSGVDISDFSLTTSGATIGTIAAVSPVSGNVFDISLTFVSGNGTVRLDLKPTGTNIKDAAGNGIISGFTGGQTYTFQTGFSSVVRLSPIDITKTTQDKPQGKVWNYDNKWWCVLPATGGTKIFRLDGTSWTSVLTLTTTASTSKPDCIVQNNLVHILGFKENGTSYFYTVEYDPALSSYKLWQLRPTNTPINFPAGSETANIAVDGTGRMWVASESTNTVYAWWSDAPYATWSAPITIATGILEDDICAITAIPTQGKIGILWSNQSTKRFGFKTHTDGASPGTWSADESPASQSAQNVGSGFADDHMNIKVASDGTLYCSAKTSYDKKNNPQLILLVRRPAGTWDNAYTETMYSEGTQSLIMLNEAQGKLKVFYTSSDEGGNIVYRESPTSAISFGAAITLITDPGILYNYVTSTHQNCNSDVVIMATNTSSNPIQAVSVLASDGSSSSQSITGTSISALKSEAVPLFTKEKEEQLVKAYPNPFAYSTNLTFTLPYSSAYKLSLYNNNGMKQMILKNGWAAAGVTNTFVLNGSSLANGLYLVNLQTEKTSQVIKVLVNK